MPEDQDDMVKKTGDNKRKKNAVAAKPNPIKHATRSKSRTKPDSAAEGVLVVFNSSFDDGSSTHDPDEQYSAFLKKLSSRERKELIKLELELLSQYCPDAAHPIKYRLLKAPIPNPIKAQLLRRLQSLGNMEDDDSEAHKLREWFESMLSLPLGKIASAVIDQDEAGISAFMDESRSTLDQCVFGMCHVKDRIMQLIAQTISNPAAAPTAICLEGPAGVGKTRIISHGLAKVLCRPYVHINLGGAKDSSFLTGHDYTYMGARYGHLAEALINAQCMNPIIHFDELDKVSDSAQGQEICGLLIHLIDGTQNTRIYDKFFSQIPLDFSKALFTFSFNDANKVDPILLDRMMRLQVPGYKASDKVTIALDFLLPEIMSNTGLSDEDIILDRHDIKYIIDKYTSGEPGLRSLHKCIETLLLKINMMLLCPAYSTEHKQDLMTRPFIITQDIIDKTLKSIVAQLDIPPFGMYV